MFSTKQSLQRIEDHYIQKGLIGDQLRKALKDDREYQNILTERKGQLTKSFAISPEEETKYVLSTDEDYEILGKIKQLEKMPLSPEDRELIVFIRSQLEDDWRTPLLTKLEEISKKYQ